MPETRDGEPAFPTEPNTQPGFYAHQGMSLRDWFAGQALAAIIAGPGAREGVPLREWFDAPEIAYERGIEPGGMMWQLTELGRAALQKDTDNG